jgi:ornithine carbamoyltransferase
MVRHYLSILDLSRDELDHVLTLSAEIKHRPGAFREALMDRNIALVFMKPSTRTRISFEAGINQLGGSSVVLSSAELQLGRGETIADTARVFSRYLDGVMARVFEHEALEEMARWGTIPVINGLSDRLHPCQALCDYFTIMEHRGGDLSGLRLAYVGDGNNVAHSLMLGAAALGVDIHVATPPGYPPDAEVVALARRRGEGREAAIVVDNSPADAVRDADVVYTDVWASMGKESEHDERLAAFGDFRVTLDLFEMAAPDALFMHCLPAHRGEEVVHEVMEHERSIVFDQAENRLHTQKALLCYLFDTDED